MTDARHTLAAGQRSDTAAARLTVADVRDSFNTLFATLKRLGVVDPGLERPLPDATASVPEWRIGELVLQVREDRLCALNDEGRIELPESDRKIGTPLSPANMHAALALALGQPCVVDRLGASGGQALLLLQGTHAPYSFGMSAYHGSGRAAVATQAARKQKNGERS